MSQPTIMPDDAAPVSAAAGEREPWVAYARTGPSHRSTRSPSDHATIDGKTTLCGLKEIGGHEPSIPFRREAALSCQRCARVLRSVERPAPTPGAREPILIHGVRPDDDAATFLAALADDFMAGLTYSASDKAAIANICRGYAASLRAASHGREAGAPPDDATDTELDRIATAITTAPTCGSDQCKDDLRVSLSCDYCWRSRARAALAALRSPSVGAPAGERDVDVSVMLTRYEALAVAVDDTGNENARHRLARFKQALDAVLSTLGQAAPGAPTPREWLCPE